MKIRYLYSAFFVFIFSHQLIAQNIENCNGIRYIKNVFKEVTKTTVQYGYNITADNVEQALYLDVYEPEGDELQQRPLILLAHGGAFVSGQRSDMALLCIGFAQKGYVAATIDYRLWEGFSLDSLKALDVMIKAYGDMKAAVRFFREDAATENLFRIDPAHIIVGGGSSGAITALHVAYMDESDLIPNYLREIINDNGGMEGSSGDAENLQYSSEVRGVFNLSGALYQADWIGEEDPFLVSYHGTADDIVPYGKGFLGATVGPIRFELVAVDGSLVLHTQAKKVNVPTFIRPVQNGGHTDIYDFGENETILNDFIQKALLFIQDQFCEELEKVDVSPFIETYPNPANEFVKIDLSEIEGNYDLVIYDIMGREHHRWEGQTEKRFTFFRKDFGAGVWILRFDFERDNFQPVSRKIVFR